MSQAILSHVSNSVITKEMPVIHPGMVVRVHQKIKEGEKERIQIFEGLVISMNAGDTKADKTLTVRKVVEGVGVEKIFPIYSKMVEKIEVVKQGKVRRAKLYYMRDLEGKSTRLQEDADVAEELREAATTEKKRKNDEKAKELAAAKEAKEAAAAAEEAAKAAAEAAAEAEKATEAAVVEPAAEPAAEESK